MPAARRALDGRRHARRRPRPRAARRGDRAGNGRRRRFRPRAARRGDGTALKPIPAARRLANGNCRRHCDLRRHRPRAARLGAVTAAAPAPIPDARGPARRCHRSRVAADPGPVPPGAATAPGAGFRPRAASAPSPPLLACSQRRSIWHGQ
jgi:hypothetical protein